MLQVVKTQISNFLNSKIIVTILGTLGSYYMGLMFNPRIAYAQAVCENVDYEDPSIVEIICPVIAFVNFLVMFVGVMLVGYILFAAYKYAMAQGDPRSLEDATKTLTYAILGAVLVAGVFTLLSVVGGLFGIDSSLTSGAVYNRVSEFMCSFLQDSANPNPINPVWGQAIINNVRGCQ